MSVNYETISIPIATGANTKADPKMLPAQKLTSLTDCVFNADGRITKRNGYDSLGLNIIGGGTIGSQTMVGTYGNRLLCSDGTSLYDYSESSSAWKNGGKWDSYNVTDTLISSAFQLERNASTIISGTFSILTYDYWSTSGLIEGGNGTSVYLSVIDVETGTTVVSDVLVSGTGRYSRPFAFGDGNLGVFYYNPGLDEIVFKSITISSGVVTLGTETSVAVGPIHYGDTGDGYTQYDWISYDIIANGNNCSLAFSELAGSFHVTLNTVNSSGVFQSTGKFANVGYAYPISLTSSSNGNIWAYWAKPNANNKAPGPTTSILYGILSSSLTSVLSAQTLAGTYNLVRQLVGQPVSATQQNLYFSVVPFVSGIQTVDMVTPTIYRCANSTSGSVADPFAYLFNLDIFGKWVNFNGKDYLPCVYPSVDQNTGFFVDLSDGHAAAKFLFNSAECAYSAEVDAPITGPSIGGYWWRYPGFLSVVTVFDSTTIIFASGKIIQFNGAGSLAPKYIMGSCLVEIDCLNQDAFKILNANGIMILNGGLPSIYDGNIVSELGFNHYPELNGTVSATGGFLVAGTYEYQAIYTWSDAQGNLYQSEDSDPFSVTTTGSTSATTVVIKIPALTQRNYSKNQITLALYRTVVNGTIPYLVAVKPLNGTTGTVTIVDVISSVSLSVSANPLYTQGGAIVSNSPSPPSMIMWLNNNRLWMVNSEDQSIWYSKTFATLTGISVSAFLTLAPDLRSGNIVAGQAMDEKTIILKQSGMTYFIGDGADDSGSNSSLTLPQIIPASIGASTSKGVYLYPGGVLFQAANNRGIYLLTRGIQIEYIGSDMEAFNDQDIQSVIAVADTTHIRFLSSFGTTLVYDYYYKQWGTFSNHQGVASTIWQGVYIYSRSDGSMYQEDPTLFLDNTTPYAATLTTAWIKAGAIQGFQRVRRCALLGDFKSGANNYAVEIAAAYDFSPTFHPAITYILGLNAQISPYQYRERLPIQKCDTIQLKITELPTGDTQQYIDFNDLGLEIGIKKGLNKLPASQSVG